MDFTRKFVFSLGVGCILSFAVKASDTASLTDNPYAPVVVRNMFGLLPIPTNPPTVQPPADPPPKITPNGIMSLFGELQVLFKVSIPPKSGQPPHDESYTLSEGERQDDIEVVKIDEKASTITFNNHGTIQELPLASAPNVNTPALPVSSGPGMGNPGMGRGRFGKPNAPSPFNQGPSFGGGGGSASGGPTAGMGGPSSSFGINSAGINVIGGTGTENPNDELSPEAKVLMIEQQRTEWQQKGNPGLAILPPTPLTSQTGGQQ